MLIALEMVNRIAFISTCKEEPYFFGLSIWGHADVGLGVVTVRKSTPNRMKVFIACHGFGWLWAQSFNARRFRVCQVSWAGPLSLLKGIDAPAGKA